MSKKNAPKQKPAVSPRPKAIPPSKPPARRIKEGVEIPPPPPKKK